MVLGARSPKSRCLRAVLPPKAPGVGVGVGSFCLFQLWGLQVFLGLSLRHCSLCLPRSAHLPCVSSGFPEDT